MGRPKKQNPLVIEMTVNPGITEITAPIVLGEADAVVVEERRAPDQDGAIEVAFVEAVLPEEDRRAPEPEVPNVGLHITNPDAFASLSGVPNTVVEPALPETNELHGFTNNDIGRKPVVTD